MSDLAAEAAMVAEVLDAVVGFREGNRIALHPAGKPEWSKSFWICEWSWLALVSLARRLRKAEQERDEVERRLVGMNQAWLRDLEAKRFAEQDRDRLAMECRHYRDLALQHAQADHMTGGYRVASEPPVPEPAVTLTLGWPRPTGEPPVPEPAYDTPEPCDGTASVPVKECWDELDWRRAERAFG